MSRRNGKSVNRWIQTGRFFTQAVALTLTCMGAYAAIRGMGMPKWAFFSLVVLAGLFFCGWLCPFGTIQEWLRHVGKNALGITIVIPSQINRYLLCIRYVLLAVVVIFAISLYEPRLAFTSLFSGKIAGTGALVMMVAMFVLSLFVDRPFCRYLCGFGAQYGLLSVLRIFTIKRDGAKCVGCKKCDTACLMGVKVSTAKAVRHPHCINCFKCVAACPIPGAVKQGFAFPRISDAMRKSSRA